MRVLGRIVADELERAEEDESGPPAEAEVEGAILKLDLWFIAAAHAAAAARSALGVLADRVEDGMLQEARLLVTELVTNSVRHAGVGRESSIGLALLLTPSALTVAVTDPGPGFRPEVVTPDLEQEGGRGLFIVDQLADRWGVGDSPLEPPARDGRAETGTVVWFELAA
jgi:anti-sigma regulatory factor (Ser/Thr protein kinase)